MRIILSILIFALISCSQNHKPQLVIDDLQRDQIFTQFVDPITEEYQLGKLRETYLLNDDFEVRIWVESFGDIDGFLLRKVHKRWFALAIKRIDCKRVSYFPKNKKYELGKFELLTPKSGWANTWKSLVESEILDLPGANYPALDGMGYSVETNFKGKYRIYHYGNPQLHKNDEGKQMIKIGEIIANEFGLHNFKVGSFCLEK